MPSKNLLVTAQPVLNLANIFQTLSLRTSTTPTLSRCGACAFSTTSVQHSSRKKSNKNRINDPYRAAQAKQRRSANLARQATLQQQRAAAMGDPIRSRPTPFIQSLTSPSSSIESTQNTNFFLNTDDVAQQISHSKWLTEPIPLSELNRVSSPEDPQKELKRLQDWEGGHENAERAVQNITSLLQGSSGDKTRLNIQRCIEEFGRHNTDAELLPKPASLKQPAGLALTEAEQAAAAELAAIPPRVGRDTGSSEVQIAILTAKINVLANNVGKKDKHNKRNLQLLVHRRQKLLSYLRRKERGGPRWQNLVEKLGISDAMWKGEISL